MIELLFKNREEFRSWLLKHNQDDDGIWVIFGKKNGPKTLTPDEALEEALCFGWIDGLIKKIDDKTYMKYFKKRLTRSNWSKRNRKFAEKLINEEKMTEFGFLAIEKAKNNGTWIIKNEEIKKTEIESFQEMLTTYKLAYDNFLNMSNSVKKTYTGYYLSAKKEQTRKKRFQELVNRFEKNLKPLEKEI